MPLVDEVHHVVHVDGIHLHRDAVVLIAVAGGHVIGWHVAKSEKAAAWQCLMARIAPPDVLVCDGGGGVLKAAKAGCAGWPCPCPASGTRAARPNGWSPTTGGSRTSPRSSTRRANTPTAV